ncbi:MAG TPA: hypothetical protein VKY37_10075, partial [Brumimicrobium sp.]|nr:hypothetical protein [Brumimicrobium sp.]
ATPFSIEVLMGTNNDGINWKAPALRGRYFLSNNLAVRLQLALGDGIGASTGSQMSELHEFYEFSDGTGGVGTQKINRVGLALQLGAEYHFLGTQKLDPYASFGINFGGGSEKQVFTAVQPGVGYNPAYGVDVKGGYSVFGAQLGLGMDFYFVENVYFGVELGLGFGAINRKDREQVATITPGGVNTTVTEGYKEAYLGTQAAFRLGWRF